KKPGCRLGAHLFGRSTRGRVISSLVRRSCLPCGSARSEASTPSRQANTLEVPRANPYLPDAVARRLWCYTCCAIDVPDAVSKPPPPLKAHLQWWVLTGGEMGSTVVERQLAVPGIVPPLSG